jgi:hypothetical protein
MKRKLESASLEYTLGPSYMEDDARAETDRTGFCAAHWEKLYAAQNRLGLSLITLTHVRHIIQVMDKRRNANPIKRSGIFSKSTDPPAPLYDGLRGIESGCCICARVGESLNRYIDTMFSMWPKTPELHTRAEDCGGFCLTHFVTLLNQGPRKLNERGWREFLDAVYPIQRKSMETLEADLDWFIKKFDYRYADEPWGNSKDALPRALRTVGGIGKKEDGNV